MKFFDIQKEQAVKYALLKFSENHGLPTTAHVLVNVFPTHRLVEGFKEVKPNSY